MAFKSFNLGPRAMPKSLRCSSVSSSSASPSISFSSKVSANRVKPFASSQAPNVPSCSRQLVEQRLWSPSDRRVKALGEPAVDGREEVARLLPLAPLGPQAGETCRGAEFGGSGLLLSGNLDRPEKAALGFPRRFPDRREQLTFQPMDLRLRPAFAALA